MSISKNRGQFKQDLNAMKIVLDSEIAHSAKLITSSWAVTIVSSIELPEMS